MNIMLGARKRPGYGSYRYCRKAGSGFGSASASEVAVRTHVAWYYGLLQSFAMLSVSLALAAWIYDAGRNIAGFDRRDHLRSAGRTPGANQRDLRPVRGLLRGIASGLTAISRSKGRAAATGAAGQDAGGGECGIEKQDLALSSRLVPDIGAAEQAVRINRFRVEPDGAAVSVSTAADAQCLAPAEGVPRKAAVPAQSAAGGKRCYDRRSCRGAIPIKRFALEVKYFLRAEGAPSGAAGEQF